MGGDLEWTKPNHELPDPTAMVMEAAAVGSTDGPPLAPGYVIEAPASLLTHQEVLMFPSYRHAPVIDPNPKRYPVCNQSVYSLAGIHPQCAVRLDDPPKLKGKAKGEQPRR